MEIRGQPGVDLILPHLGAVRRGAGELGTRGRGRNGSPGTGTGTYPSATRGKHPPVHGRVHLGVPVPVLVRLSAHDVGAQAVLTSKV